ncbi:MAG: DUF1905 domain-containing protein [Capsulimonadaceae bacterium]|nr:DUF1905 domain-containing protein [Capsulimonadaceae bacterium]
MNERYTFRFKAKVWLYRSAGHGTWYFVTVPQELSDEIDGVAIGLKGGWGSVRVNVTVGQTNWKTSVFPDKSEMAYILPLKASVRKKEGIEEGSTIDLILEIE